MAGPARQSSPQEPLDGIIGTSPAMQEVRALIRKLGPLPENVLIQGESGTGKDLVARALHRASPWAQGPFVAVNCSAIQEGLLASELFGHEKGAFTSAVTAKPGLFEVADEGTLFIDEIGEMRQDLQAKLLRVLEDGRVRRVGGTEWLQTRVRVLTATNKELTQEVAAGRFRLDLYYRLNVLVIALPPLRQRREDIPPLVRHFLALDRWGPQEIEFTALQALLAHDWPGNVRELHNAIKRAKARAEGPRITVHDLPSELGEPPNCPLPPGSTMSGTQGQSLDELEKQHVQWALQSAGGNKARAARNLGITRQRLYRLLHRHGLGE